ncbi:hypothetical protein PR048_030505 [Dryococelus australis]|uniref:Uncharacterized protein n=1 Tax=Dryococelus australis TaxID=614101 RepID=A0ABQ9GD08_9NEOP|nr:hypothetical protein PR048_030505 [Dryococelus australis]
MLGSPFPGSITQNVNTQPFSMRDAASEVLQFDTLPQELGTVTEYDLSCNSSCEPLNKLRKLDDTPIIQHEGTLGQELPVASCTQDNNGAKESAEINKQLSTISLPLSSLNNKVDEYQEQLYVVYAPSEPTFDPNIINHTRDILDIVLNKDLTMSLEFEVLHKLDLDHYPSIIATIHQFVKLHIISIQTGLVLGIICKKGLICQLLLVLPAN